MNIAGEFGQERAREELIHVIDKIHVLTALSNWGGGTLDYRSAEQWLEWNDETNPGRVPNLPHQGATQALMVKQTRASDASTNKAATNFSCTIRCLRIKPAQDSVTEFSSFDSSACVEAGA